jgi:hypothetical protein
VPRSVDELVRVGEAGLRSHLAERAILAHRKYGRLTASSLPGFLRDPECVRRPTRIVFGFGPMAPHQFAEPAPDPDDPSGEGIALYLRPALERRPDLWPIAVAYVVPLINYGGIVHDGHCLTYGATRWGMLEEGSTARSDSPTPPGRAGVAVNVGVRSSGYQVLR